MKKKLSDEKKAEFWQKVEERNLTDSALSRMLNVSPATVYCWRKKDFVPVDALATLNELKDLTSFEVDVLVALQRIENKIGELAR